MLEYNNDLSPSENLFVWWLEDLKEYGFLKSYIFEPTSWRIYEPVMFNTLKPMKRVPDKVLEKKLLDKHDYTCDFELKFTDKGIELFLGFIKKNIKGELHMDYEDVVKPFIANECSNRAFIEIKPDNHDYQNKTQFVSNTIKSVWDKFNDYVNLIKPERLFKSTFYPSRYFYNDSGKDYRKKIVMRKRVPIKDLDNYISIDTWLNNIKN